ncbi:hypothetical protein HRbin11_00972 [bacterium HR11]|nr:hypothetical protein HRbin11_00972 [bacterium HR11]
MRLLADENVDGPIVTRLRQEGHQVIYVAEMEPGLSDEAVLQMANRENAVLMTADRDFGELIFRLRKDVPGVILLRLAGLPPERKADTVAQIIANLGSRLQGAFTVIGVRTVRRRRVI